jgi:hypothetical protein
MIPASLLGAILWAIAAGTGLVLWNEQSVLAVIGFMFCSAIAISWTAVVIYELKK